MQSSTRHAPIILTTMENCLENFEKIGTFLIKNPKMITFFSQICRLLADLTKNLIFRKKYHFIKVNIRFSHYFYSVVSNCPSSVFVAREQILSRDCLFTKNIHTALLNATLVGFNRIFRQICER